jgi:hypothetical protein
MPITSYQLLKAAANVTWVTYARCAFSVTGRRRLNCGIVFAQEPLARK